MKATHTPSRKEECGQEIGTTRWQTLQTEQNQTSSQAPEGLTNMLSLPSGQQAAPRLCRHDMSYVTWVWYLWLVLTFPVSYVLYSDCPGREKS